MKQTTATVLIVDKDSETRAFIAQHLSKAGHTTLEAEDGYKALELLRFRKIDIVTSELSMPHLSGLQLLRAMRSTGCLQAFVIISNQGPRHEIVELLRLGAFDFVEKPFDPDNLCHVIAQAASLVSHQAVKKNELIESMGITEGEMSRSQEQAIRQIARLKTLNAKRRR